MLLDFGAAGEAISQRSHTLNAIIKPGYSPPEQFPLISLGGLLEVERFISTYLAGDFALVIERDILALAVLLEPSHAQDEVLAPRRGSDQSWSRLFEQIFRVDKWVLCRG